MNYYLQYNQSKLASNMPDKCSRCINECNKSSEVVNCLIDGQKRRRGSIKESTIKLIYICTNNKDLLKSSKLFKYRLNIYNEMFLDAINLKKEISQKINKKTKRLIHNITSINARNIQELYALVPQEILTKNLNQQLDNIKAHIEINVEEAAKTFLRIAKNNASMKCEFAVFRKLNELSKNLDMKQHIFRKVALNVFHIFFQDFTENNVYVDINENVKFLKLDYETIHVALYHLIDNAVKYILPNTTLRVLFKETNDKFIVQFDMISIQILDSELDKIMEEGISGNWAIRLKRNGDGIGLNYVKKLLEFNYAVLVVNKNVKNYLGREVDGVKYENNVFEIHFSI